MLLKICSFCTTHKSSVSTGFREQIMPILRILCYNGSLVTYTVVRFTTAKFKPLIFSMSGFALSCTTKVFILMISYDLCLSSAQFCYTYNRIYTEGWKLCENRWPVCTLENFQWCGEPCFFIGAAILRGGCLPLIPRRGKHKPLLPPTNLRFIASARTV
jgi:hypothetical protein